MSTIVTLIVFNWGTGLLFAIPMGVEALIDHRKQKARTAFLLLAVGGLWVFPYFIVIGVVRLWLLADFKRTPKIPKAKVVP